MPSQSRSRASLDRMLGAARKLMIDRQGEDFTLQEVSRLGEVSIGSIYFRFQNNQDLVRAVIGHELFKIAEAEAETVNQALRSSATLGAFVPAYVCACAENLRAHSLMLRLAMRRAATDPEMSEAGEAHEQEASQRLSQSLEHFRAQISGDVQARAKVAFHLLFATIARHLSLDSHAPLVGRLDWDVLLTEMSSVIYAYLTSASTPR